MRYGKISYPYRIIHDNRMFAKHAFCY
ncbi:hypothetical protein RO1_14490 [Roseburia intestinalis XB6B4]|uniref:Uncharacterized protein n=1 Tax=Roseburia intestinalis XB6B4 TaxID=718255 RepID=D4KXH4_9FIRM|nr:hypothetical protein RO1_14490 [Roseburia intestinalis XB6B4]